LTKETSESEKKRKEIYIEHFTDFIFSQSKE